MAQLASTSIPVIALLVGLLLVYFVIALKRGWTRRSSRYKTFFVIGLPWLPLGFMTDNYPLGVMGVCFVVYGLANRDKWENEKQCPELTDQEKKKRALLLILLSLSFLIGVALLLEAQ
ncbi:MAG: hypothetical protein ABGY10_03965 [bacterium]|nr:hypothetical protein [Gemmatimonadota bacterium]HIL89770.1 hypothetical protein [Gemmatimonadota bacterium]